MPALGARAQPAAAWEAARELARARGVIGHAAADAIELACGSYLTAATREYVLELRPDLAVQDAHYAATQVLTPGFMHSRSRVVLAALRDGMGALSDAEYVRALRDFRRAVEEFAAFDALRAELDSMVPAAFLYAQANAIMIAPRTPPAPIAETAERNLRPAARRVLAL